MRTGGLFRRNTVVTPKRDEDFGDYATVISSEDDPKRLKEYITRLYKSLKEKSKSLRSAYTKLDLLNNEISQEKTRFVDIEDENKSLRDQMQGMADQLASKDELFSQWQAKLVEQTQRERDVLIEEMDEERAQFKERINQLEDALNLANVEITRLTIEMTDLTNSQKKRRISATSTTDENRSSLDILFNGNKNKEDDRYELTKQILEITQRRISLQTELTLLEDKYDDLKVNRVLNIKDHIRSSYVDSIKSTHEGEPTTPARKRHSQATDRQKNVYEISRRSLSSSFVVAQNTKY
ncbi:46350_t:CDS:2 [Gigaspora margarita]|uniref:46350_t:CDS:1 n=1 Tax=Gigaspora margarita TaxID=4874 RepID=A0ABM8VX43_GIGMA|nr:46350_t:CDS:2 [Gigaspora margarita]